MLPSPTVVKGFVQLRHVYAPEWFMYVLTAQGRHACAPLSLYLPLGQASHAEFADPVLYVPALQ